MPPVDPRDAAICTMKALILSAGQGSRLLPLTANCPKCLIDLSGRPFLEWQLRALAQAGVTETVVVTGFGAEKVEAMLQARAPDRMQVRTLFNPFYAVADNLASCWIARAELNGPCLILNGDTLFEPAIAEHLLAAPAADITVAIDRKSQYDADDMKVQSLDGRLLAIGKRLAAQEVNGESIGFLRFSAAGAARFVAEIEQAMLGDGVKQWYLSAIDRIAKAAGIVRVASVQGLNWSEMDFHADLARCRELSDAWLHSWTAPRLTLPPAAQAG